MDFKSGFSYLGATEEPPSQVVTSEQQNSAPPVDKQTGVSTAPTENLTFDQLFRNGVTSYQAKDFAKSADSFKKALVLQDSNAAALTNLGLAEYNLGNEGLAIAYWRKAIDIDPDFFPAISAVRYALDKLPVKEIPHEIETWERIRDYTLTPVPIQAYLILSALFLFSAGWLLITFAGKRKIAMETEQAPPGIPTLGVIFALCFVLCTALGILKSIDSGIARGTIVSEKISAQSAPGEGQASLFDLYEGLEVKIRSASGDWLQVTYPGALTGWLPKSSLMQTSGRPLY